MWKIVVIFLILTAIRLANSTAQESIPAKSTKDLEFRKYIVENILKNFEKHAFRKRQKHFVLKEWNR